MKRYITNQINIKINKFIKKGKSYVGSHRCRSRNCNN